ncbi:helix-turn-helix domain-containing protein [Arthrobacter sp. B2a2-09]|uniref:helix-turn-helix domain-containing protein n=1 Tax=Arthrobacter sp. B2a2-09 TaxID=2952822 RepID=UPI0022CD805C|nr:helix-turn-helix transcriptional regulator [Arthrobacter sp. B2a2-09]MCZ9884051.1 helix-turn-helix transcriptional regulator [Arthrobacter sp. B2a2-09]
MSNESNAYGTNLARVHAHVGPQDECTPCAPDGPDAKRNGADLARARACVGPQSETHRGSVPDHERQALASGFGAELAKLRSATSFSQARLGDLAGLRGDHIGRLERGQRRPTVAAIIAVSRILVPEAQREATQRRLATLAGTSLREGKARKKQAKENKHRRAAIQSSQRVVRQMQQSIRMKEARGEIVAGNFRSLAERLAEQTERLKAEMVPEAPVIRGYEPRPSRPRSRRKADILAYGRQLLRLNDPEDDDEDEL